MAVLSRAFRPASELLLRPNPRLLNLLVDNGIKRCMSHGNTIVIRPTQWQWKKSKDLFHFYFLLGAIPWALIIIYLNVFIGPATLEEIPEGYEPKHWEYDRHPFSRFIARYIMNSTQQEYEKNLAHLYLEKNAMKLKSLSTMAERYMGQYQDYQGRYFRQSFSAESIYKFRSTISDWDLQSLRYLER